MALPGYPKTFDHPKMQIIEEGTTVTGQISFIKAMGNESTDWIEYIVKMPNSYNPDEDRTIRINVGSSLYGPFSSVNHEDEGATGAVGSAQDCYTQIFETEI